MNLFVRSSAQNLSQAFAGGRVRGPKNASFLEWGAARNRFFMLFE